MRPSCRITGEDEKERLHGTSRADRWCSRRERGVSVDEGYDDAALAERERESMADPGVCVRVCVFVQRG